MDGDIWDRKLYKCSNWLDENWPDLWIRFGYRIGGKVSILHRRQSCIATHVFVASFSSRICRHNRRPLALHDHPTLDVSSIPGADSKVFGKMNLGILQSITLIATPRSKIIKVNEACWRNPACTKATSIYIYIVYTQRSREVQVTYQANRWKARGDTYITYAFSQQWLSRLPNDLDKQNWSHQKPSYFPLYWLAFMFVPSHVWTLHQWVGPHLRCLKKLLWENCTTRSAPRRLVGTWAKGKAGTAVYDLVVFPVIGLNRFVSSQKAKPQEVFLVVQTHDPKD